MFPFAFQPETQRAGSRGIAARPCVPYQRIGVNTHYQIK